MFSRIEFEEEFVVIIIASIIKKITQKIEEVPSLYLLAIIILVVTRTHCST